jgi:hypothetical protein
VVFLSVMAAPCPVRLDAADTKQGTEVNVPTFDNPGQAWSGVAMHERKKSGMQTRHDCRSEHDERTAGRTSALAKTSRIGLYCAITAVLFTWPLPAGAFFKEVKPPRKVGVDCVEKLRQLAPKLTTCSAAGNMTLVWCPNGQVYGGVKQQVDPSGSLARSLCNMTQVP